MFMTPALAPRSTILVVDDQPGVLAILDHLMRELAPAYEIVSVADGETALTHIAHHTVPLVFMDYHMPAMTGLELTTVVKASHPAVQVVLMTAHDTTEVRQRAYACGVDYFLPKPFSFTDLEGCMHVLLS
jgi:CheY-like chemotaxis protein